MRGHVIDDDLVICCAEERGQLLIQALNEVPPLEIVEIAKLYIRLRCQIGRSEREGMNGRGFDIAHEKNVVRAEGDRTRGLERTGYAAAGNAVSRNGCVTGQSQPNSRGRGKS
jgi:hypothetical protein